MDFVADYDIDWRRAEETIFFDVPACACEQSCAGGGERGEIGHGGSGDEAGAGACGKAQKIEGPLKHDLFEHGGDGRNDQHGPF